MLHIALADVICLIAWRVTTVCVSRHAKATMTWFAVKTFNSFFWGGGGGGNWIIGGTYVIAALMGCWAHKPNWAAYQGAHGSNWMESQCILNGICVNTKSQWYLCNANSSDWMSKCHSISLGSVTVHPSYSNLNSCLCLQQPQGSF